MLLSNKRERQSDEGGMNQSDPSKRLKLSQPPNQISNHIDQCLTNICLNHCPCSICGKDISKSIQFICSQCEKNPIFCFNCFITIKDNDQYSLHEHDYYIIDKMNIPLFTSDWSLKDELRLIESVGKYGLDNWGDISDNMKNRGKVECESHYYSFYYRDKEHTIPSNDTIVIKPNDINDIANDNGNDTIQSSFTINEDLLKLNMEYENTIKEKTMCNQGIIPEPSLLTDRTSKRGRSIIKNINTKTQNAIQSASEILGYWPKREEFDIEFLNDAELEIAEVEFLDEDTEADRKLKMEVLKAYNNQLDERKLRKDFIIQKNLFDLKRQMNFESKLSKEDREIYNCIKPLARFYDYSEFFDLYEGLVLEKNLKQKLYQLKQYQKQGLNTIEDIQKYLDIDVKNPKKFLMTSREIDTQQQIQTPLATSSIGERVARFIKYNNANESGNDNDNDNDNDNNHNSETNEGLMVVLNSKESSFVKELPLPKSLFCEIKSRIANDVKTCDSNVKSEKIESIIQSYEIEKQTSNELITFFNSQYAN